MSEVNQAYRVLGHDLSALALTSEEKEGLDIAIENGIDLSYFTKRLQILRGSKK